MTELQKAERDAAREMDWQQVVLNGGPPCFHLLRYSRDTYKFCGRAERWFGHGDKDGHDFVSLESLITAASEAGQSAKEHEMATLAQKVTTIVFEQLDRNCEWLVGEDHAVGLVRAALKEARDAR